MPIVSGPMTATNNFQKVVVQAKVSGARSSFIWSAFQIKRKADREQSRMSRAACVRWDTSLSNDLIVRYTEPQQVCRRRLLISKTEHQDKDNEQVRTGSAHACRAGCNDGPHYSWRRSEFQQTPLHAQNARLRALGAGLT